MIKRADKNTKRTLLVLTTKDKVMDLPYFDDQQKKFIQSKLEKKINVFFCTKENMTTFVYIYGYTKEGNKYEQLEHLRNDGNLVYVQLKSILEKDIFLECNIDLDSKQVRAFLGGLIFSDYEFLKYRPKEKKFELTVTIPTTMLTKEEVDHLNIQKEALKITKDFVNEPVSYLTATQYSKDMQAICKEVGIKATVWNQKKIEQEKMGGILAVNKGSLEPATFNILEYKPAKPKNSKPLVLVGKGVVFDTGGISLKPGAGMEAMKCDMAGSACVVGGMYAIAKAKLNYHVIGLIPAVENRPSDRAICPGDIITMYDGSTVEVLNTDAEGRLILADALHYAKKLHPELVLDFATLTGSAMRAIGREAAVIMGTADKSMKKKIRKAANKTGDRVVEFPMWREYGEYMKSDIADLKNLGPAEAGSITAGKFLEYFTSYPWMHFDIAGPAFVTSPYSYRGKWATGYGVRLLFTFVKNLCKDDSEKRETESRHNAG